MIYYSVFAALSLFLLVFHEIHERKWLLYILLFLAFLFSALRYDAGYDYFSYYNYMMSVEGARFNDLEFFNKHLTDLAIKYEAPQFYFFVTSLLYVSFMALGFNRLNRLDSITLVMFVFFIGSYLTSFDIIRQMVAVSIVFYATARLVSKSYLSSIFFAVIAYGFHRSAVIFIIIFLFVIILSNRKYRFVIYAAAFAASFFMLDVVAAVLNYFDLYSSYINRGGNDTGGKIYLMLCFMVLALLFFSRRGEVTDRFWVYFNLFFLGFLIYTVFLPYGYFVTRISYFLFPWGFVAFSELIESVDKNKWFLKVGVYAFSLLIFCLTLYMSSSLPREPYLNYNFYFMR